MNVYIRVALDWGEQVPCLKAEFFCQAPFLFLEGISLGWGLLREGGTKPLQVTSGHRYGCVANERDPRFHPAQEWGNPRLEEKMIP